MINLYGVSKRLATYIAEETELEQGHTDSVRYGLEIILGTMIKGIVLLTTAFFLGILNQVVAALICGSLLRLISGGAHCSSYLRCLICGMVIYLSVGKASIYLETLLNRDHLIIILIPSFFAMVLCAYFWAPAEVPYKSLSINEASQFKRMTIIFLILCLAFVLFSPSLLRMSYIIAGLLALLAQTFSYSPPGYSAIGKIDSCLLIITKGKEVKDNAKS